MKRIRIKALGILALGLLVTALFGAEQHSQPSDPDKQVAELTGQVRLLRGKIKSLEERLDKLEKAKGLAGPASPPLVIPPAPRNQDSIRGYFADPNHPPQIWGEGECNGWKYYVIPLSGHEAAPDGAIVPVTVSGLRGSSK